MNDERTSPPSLFELFDRASDLPPVERAGFLAAACPDDPALRDQVMRLLAGGAVRTDDVLRPIGADAAPSEIAGQRLGAYTLLRSLGEGGMGRVVLARREDLDMHVAIKLLRAGRLSTPTEMQRFLHEGRLLGRLNHPHIARLLDAGWTEQGMPYLALEYVDGVPIDQYCRDHGLSLERRLALFVDLCAAVQYAHRSLIVHRDIKPANILVTKEGTAKLLDFGIGKLLDDAEARGEALTREGVLLLTPEYATPEQLQLTPITTATDVYSLGIVLYELLTGRRPYHITSRSAAEIQRVVCETLPEPPSAVLARAGRHGGGNGAPSGGTSADLPPPVPWRRIHGDLDLIVMRAIAKKPERRYATVAELADDVRRHVTGFPVRARPDGRAYRLGKFIRRQRLAVAAVAAVILALGVGLSAAVVAAKRAAREQAVAERRFSDVRSLANTLIVELHDAIVDLPGSTAARELLIRKGLAHLDQLAVEAADDPLVARDVAGGYVKLGLLQGQPFGPNVGDRAGARRSYDRARAIADRVLARDPSDHRIRRTRGLALEKTGDVLAFMGNVAAGVAHQRQALAEYQRVERDNPGMQAAITVGISHLKLGDLLGNPNLPNLEDRAGARTSFLEARRRLAAVVPDADNAFRVARYRALVEERLGSLLEAEGKLAEAYSANLECLAQRRQISKQHPHSDQAKRDIAVTLESLCSLALELDRPMQALDHCRESAALEDVRTRADPNNVQNLRDLALAQVQLANALSANDEHAAAFAAARRSIDANRSFVTKTVEDVRARAQFGAILLKAGAISARASRAGVDGSAGLARKWLDEGRRILIELNEVDAVDTKRMKEIETLLARRR